MVTESDNEAEELASGFTPKNTTKINKWAVDNYQHSKNKWDQNNPKKWVKMTATQTPHSLDNINPLK